MAADTKTKVRATVVIPVDLIALAKVLSALRRLPHYEAQWVWREAGRRFGFKTETP